LYAIVDIETTGGNAQQGAITEIAIVLFDGHTIEGRFESLVNPNQPVPPYIAALTGITNRMVADAPPFASVADQVYRLLQNRVFVAHNVNFDYSFVSAALQRCGFSLSAKKLCTVRYARKVWPGKTRYGLANLCLERGIGNPARHRAGGDADATAELLRQLMAHDDGLRQLQTLLKGRNPNSYLPMNLPVSDLENLPYCAGVYYFHNQAGKVVYVGKATNLKYRVRSHFANNSTNQRKQDFIRDIYSISHRVCATDLMAQVLEALEIKRLWPMYNRSQKRFEQLYCLYSLTDQKGRLRWAIEKKRKHLPALYVFHAIAQGYALCRKLAATFNIHEQEVFAATNRSHPPAESTAHHNFKMKAAANHLVQHLPHFGIVQAGANERGEAVKVGFLIQAGKFVGMGYVGEQDCTTPESFRQAMTVQHDYDFVRTALYNHAERYPADVVQWAPAPEHERYVACEGVEDMGA
jgi:DNA polymerase III subunit epsilon